MLSYKMDFSFCAWKPGFVKSSHNYRLSWYVIMMITVNYHGDIIGNVSNHIFATL